VLETRCEDSGEYLKFGKRLKVAGKCLNKESKKYDLIYMEISASEVKTIWTM